MCGRYVAPDETEIKGHFKIADPQQTILPNFNAAPGQFLPVITAIDGTQRLFTMKWGLVPSWAKDDKIGYKLINARAETMFEKPMWKSVARKQRCLVPMKGFYEWKLQDGGKQPYYIFQKDSPVGAFAGVWTEWKSPDGTILRTYSIVTTNANADVSAIHNRMPVILRNDEQDIWLDNTTDDTLLQQLMDPMPDRTIQSYPVSTDVNTPKNNHEGIMVPLNSK